MNAVILFPNSLSKGMDRLDLQAVEAGEDGQKMVGISFALTQHDSFACVTDGVPEVGVPCFNCSFFLSFLIFISMSNPSTSVTGKEELP